jgi:hypothetical protein
VLVKWSYSAWQCYKQCPFKFKCDYIDGMPRVSSPALDKGNMVHKCAEDYLLGVRNDVDPTLLRLETLLKKIKKQKNLCVELGMAFTDKWVPCPWDDPSAWLRMKLDVIYPVGTNTVQIYDWKTGRAYPDHPEQLGIYALGVFKGLEMDIVHASDCYTETGTVSKPEIFQRDREERALQTLWEKRASPMFNDTIFAATPNRFCKGCSRSKGKGGPCQHG